jgi:D-sedoheptulose 7-phosphate isomerase
LVDPIRVLALDIDGVLTDGTSAVGSDGNECKRISLQDLDAVTRAKQLGLTVALVTGEDTPAVDLVAKRFAVEHVKRGAKEKLVALKELSRELRIPLGQFCYVGDGDRDAPAFAQVGLGLAPSNATWAAKASAHRVLSRSGGGGAVAEGIDILLRSQHSSPRNSEYERQMVQIVTDSITAHQRLLNESLPVLAQIAHAFVSAIRTGHKILIFGNGGSAADAQHVAGELVGRFSREREPWPAIALTTDTSILTAVGNDCEFEDIFARQVRALARPCDIVAGISTSGRSANVLRGLQAAKAKGAVRIAFTGEEGTKMAEHAEICFQAPARQTQRIQELHILAWHSICELVEAELVEEAHS